MLGILLRFLLLGFLVGGGIFVATRDLITALGTDSASVYELTTNLLTDTALFGVLGAFLAFPFGLVPALAAGLLYGAVLDRCTTQNPALTRRACLGTIIGAACAGTYGGLFFSAGVGPGTHSFEHNVTAWSVAGAVAGCICAAAAGRRAYVAIHPQRLQH